MKKILKRSFSVIKRSLNSGSASPWLKDNFYIIHRHFKALSENKTAFRCKEYFLILKQCCEEADYSASADKLTSFIAKQNRGFCWQELSNTCPLLALCAIEKAAEAVEGKADSRMLSQAIKLLFALSDPDFSDIAKNCWRPERILLQREPQYKTFAPETKALYRKLIADFARKEGLGEEEALKLLFERAGRKNLPMGTLLFAPKKRDSVLWCGLIAIFFGLIFGAGFYFIGWASLLAVIPFFIAATALADRIISLLTPTLPPPRLELSEIPDNAKTLVTVAALLNGSEGDNRVFEALERFRYMNPDKNIYFCLLADLPDSETRHRPKDKQIFENAKSRIDALNRKHGNAFCLILRERVLNKSESKFGGWERKRGAVCQLISHIKRGNCRDFHGGGFIGEIKYVLTLDSDTNLSVGSVKELLSVALHPVNRPIVKNGQAVSGYGIIQPTVKTELQSAYKTYFSRLVSGAGGTDGYAGAEFKRSQALFGSGSFCGKGLIDADLFFRLVEGKIPEGVVLSHDVVEGSLMRTLSAGDITLTDSTPANTVSFFRRAHRWLRGDFQNLYFLFKSTLTPLFRWRILLTVLKEASPIFTLLTLLAGCFFQYSNGFALFFFAFADLLIPCMASLLGIFLSGAPFACMRFFSKARSVISQTLLRLLFELSSLCRRAVLTLSAFSLSAVRLITKKKTLEWTTAAQTEKLSSTLGKYVLDSALSAIIGLGLLIFAKTPFVRFAGLLFFVYPLISALLSRQLIGGTEARPRLSEKQKKGLSAHATDMIAFYFDFVTAETNHLPPDNVQFSPVFAKALRTSPTNIGFYLVSMLAARDLGLLDSRELFERLSQSFEAIKKLPKYKGNLFNWYNIKTLEEIGNGYVSSVDCGNFTVMLVALCRGLREYAPEEERLNRIIAQAEALIEGADLTAFYDTRRRLFRIGLNAFSGVADSNCYDLLVSEARMTSYFAVSKALVPKSHWHSLGRTLTHKKGYIGLMSWSGTAFEYLMPQLFLPLYSDSFLFESIAFSQMLQKEESQIWGISESGYYSFDSEMNYQYKANGIAALALRRQTESEKIISPYSTYLSLCICGSSAVKNLKSLEAAGLYGKYGLYEALDLTGASPLCVKSYMAHHVGMSIIACMNAISDNIFVKRFMSDPAMGSAKELLQEKIPTDAHVFGSALKQNVPNAKGRFKEKQTESVNLDSPKASLLSRGDMSAVITSGGHIGLNCGETAVSNTDYRRYSAELSPAIIFSREGKLHTCCELTGEKSCKYAFEQGNGYASHIAFGREFSGRVKYSFAGESQCFIINTRAEALKKYDITLAFEPILDTKKSFRSHASFSRLFVESEYDKAEKILYFHRRSRQDGSFVFTLAIAPKDKSSEFSFLASRDNIPLGSMDFPREYARAAATCQAGELPEPYCVAKIHNAEGGKCSFLLACGITKGECLQSIRRGRSERGIAQSPRDYLQAEALLPGLLFEKQPLLPREFSKCGIGDLWSRRISGDYPRISVIADRASQARISSILKGFLALSRQCIRLELLFIVKDSDLYNRPIEQLLHSCCRRERAEGFLNKNGGIFILREGELNAEFKKALTESSGLLIDLSAESGSAEGSAPAERLEIIASPQNAHPLPLPENSFRSGNGYFKGRAYTVDKALDFYSPYSHVLAGRRFAAVVTHLSLGYTFFDNARECKIAAFSGDKYTPESGERLYLLSEGKKYDLMACSGRAVFSPGLAEYSGELNGMDFTVEISVDPKYPLKLIYVKCSDKNAEFSFEIQPIMGDTEPDSPLEVIGFNCKNSKALLFKNTFGITFPEGIGFCGACMGSASRETLSCTARGNEVLFYLGACTTEGGARAVASLVDLPFRKASVENSKLFAESLIPKISVSTKSDAFDAMFNSFVPYQVAACRFLARGSFYQSGGAYGFRDQLQDCLALIYSQPQAVRTHLIRCAAHQYSDGSVMHWWHTRTVNGVNRGIKSKCSDDLLYFPIVVADYLEKTGDYSLLEVQTEYLDSPPLFELSERYEQPKRSGVFESLYLHCLRALSRGERLGKNGLVLMGSCDWNDAFSLVGEGGLGESVFSTLLLAIAIERFIPIMEHKGDFEAARHYRETAIRLKNAVESKAFFGDRYARAICDNGTVLGIEGCKECEIDILSQAFAAMAELDEKRVKTALNTAFCRLYDSKANILKLFSPPFKRGDARVGYIRGYAAGMRENGGQYTHGALWGALGFIKAGMLEEAMTILSAANPASRCKDKAQNAIYKAEPFAIAADIYSGVNAGRGGWSHYTGAAAWFYRIALEHVLGIKLGSDSQIISAKPIIPFSAEAEINGKRLFIETSEAFGESTFNGKPVQFPIALTQGDNELKLKIT